MKTRIFTAALATLLSVTCMYAQKVFTNTESNKLGTIKELVYINDQTSNPDRKIVLVENNEDLLIEKTEYKWDEGAGWIGVKKYQYEYNENGKIENLIYTQWNKKNKDWSKKSDCLKHIYDEKGELMATTKAQIDNTSKLIAEK